MLVTNLLFFTFLTGLFYTIWPRNALLTPPLWWRCSVAVAPLPHASAASHLFLSRAAFILGRDLVLMVGESDGWMEHSKYGLITPCHCPPESNLYNFFLSGLTKEWFSEGCTLQFPSYCIYKHFQFHHQTEFCSFFSTSRFPLTFNQLLISILQDFFLTTF